LNIVCRKGPDGKMQVEAIPTVPWPAEMKAIIESEVDAIHNKAGGAAPGKAVAA
ncbi:MAG: hypothetical protein QOJ26_1893, partial [Thermoplasmata archaeon]|nr:hypothetical protein [Thermoplasmata archaeon]